MRHWSMYPPDSLMRAISYALKHREFRAGPNETQLETAIALTTKSLGTICAEQRAMQLHRAATENGFSWRAIVKHYKL